MYNEYPEILNISMASKFCGVSHITFREWLRCGRTPMGEIEEGKHYFKVGKNYKIIKSQLSSLFNIIPAEV